MPAVVDRLESLGLLRDGAPTLWTKIALGFASLAVLKRLNDAMSQAKLNNYTKDTYDWPRELVVITGGSGGIGAPMVRRFAKQGATVVNIDIIPPSDPLPSNVHFYQLDLSKPAGIADVAAQIRQKHGDPTVLVNNAGVSPMKCLLEQDLEEIQKTIDINLVSNFALVKEFLPAMVSRNHGHVVTISSMRSFVVGNRGADYGASKAASLAFHEGLAQELRHQYNARKVRTSVVHPAFVRTPIISKVVKTVEKRYNILDPEDVAEMIFRHILSGNSGQLFTEKVHRYVSGIRGFPSWMQESLRDSQFKDVVPYYMRKEQASGSR
ncbi:NAD(P)-binding protein [Thozetella sp. PMI_491]|nr:NAD(P)-binding protein [Thozetella sp. PMI_491]